MPSKIDTPEITTNRHRMMMYLREDWSKELAQFIEDVNFINRQRPELFKLSHETVQGWPYFLVEYRANGTEYRFPILSENFYRLDEFVQFKAAKMVLAEAVKESNDEIRLTKLRASALKTLRENFTQEEINQIFGK